MRLSRSFHGSQPHRWTARRSHSSCPAPTWPTTPWLNYFLPSSKNVAHTQVDGEALSLVVPCADMANHSMAPNAGYRLDADAGCFELIAARVRQSETG